MTATSASKAKDDQDRAFEDWVRLVRMTSIRDFMQARGIWRDSMAGDRGGPCPACGGRDRFAVNLKKNVFTCRASGAGGGPLALWQHLEGMDGALRGQDFLRAGADVCGEAAPQAEAETESERAQRLKQQSERAAKTAAQRREQDARQAEKSRAYADWMRRFARKLWQACVPPAGTPVEDYFALRGLALPCVPTIRFHPAVDMRARDPETKQDRLLHSGPAMVCAMTGPDFAAMPDGTFARRFAGVHVTWLELAQPKGKILIPDPAKPGEMLPAKKTFASWRGAIIALSGGVETVSRWVAGEGIETVVSVQRYLADHAPEALEGTGFVSFVNLRNFAGRAENRLRHPSETLTDSRGRTRARMVEGDVPEHTDRIRPVPLPLSLREIVWLADGDSERFWTECAVRRGALRYGRHFPDVAIRAAWPGDGVDFNDLVMGEVAG